MQDAIETAVGGKAVSQVLQGEQRYDLVVRYQAPYRDTKEAIENIRLLSPTGERVSLAQLTKVEIRDGASEIYREANSRYVALKYSVRGRDLGSTVEQAMNAVNQQVQLPLGYRLDWAGEYESQKRSQRRLLLVLPITIFGIFVILYSMFRSSKWALLILAVVAMAPLGGLLALLITGTHFSVSSGVGFLALFAVSVETGVIMLEYINQLRAAGHSVDRSRNSGSRFAAAAHHDDHARGHSRFAAGRTFTRHWVRFAKAFCHCHRRRLDGRAGDEPDFVAHAVCLGRQGRGQTSGCGGDLLKAKRVVVGSYCGIAFRWHSHRCTARCAAFLRIRGLYALAAAGIALVLPVGPRALAQTAVPAPVYITLDQAIELALQHNHALFAARTTIQQNQAQEITANLRPNPNFFADWDYLPVFAPSSANSSYLQASTEADAGLSYLIERGEKRQHRCKPPKTLRPLTCRRSPIMNAR